jgi:RNA polymerase-binding transcription factor DksA
MATKKTVPAKKAAPVKKAAPAPAKKAVPAKKAASAPTKKVVPAKKAASAKKAVPAKKAAPAPAKKVAPAPAKKAVPAKKVAPVPAKKAAPAPAKKAAPAPAKKATPAPAKKAAPIVKAPAKPAKAEKPAKPVKAPKPPKEPKAPKPPKPAPVPKAKKVPARKMVQTYRSNEPVKRTIEASISEVKPKKTIAEKFPQSVDTVIAHRVTSEMKRREKEVPTTMEVSPSYNRSLLDTLDDAAPRLRYSDVKLGEFKEVIHKKLIVARKELEFLQGIITRKNEAGTEDTENKFASMEDGSASQDREMLNQLASRQISLVEKLEQALGRVENKTYGVCRATGKLIEENRLKAVPHATLSMEAKNAR